MAVRVDLICWFIALNLWRVSAISRVEASADSRGRENLRRLCPATGGGSAAGMDVSHASPEMGIDEAEAAEETDETEDLVDLEKMS